MDEARIQTMIDNALATALNRLTQTEQANGQQGPQGEPGPPGPAGPAGNGGTAGWNAADMGYFDLHLDKLYGESEIVSVGKDIYYRNVILFVERIRDLASVKGAALIRSNINITLGGSALAWYTAELSNIERIGFRADENGVGEWCRALTTRFKESTGVALSHLTSEKYTFHDARTRREPTGYVQAVIRHSKAVNINKVGNQLTFAYQSIAAELRAFIDLPSAFTTVISFIQILKLKKDI